MAHLKQLRRIHLWSVLKLEAAACTTALIGMPSSKTISAKFDALFAQIGPPPPFLFA